MGMNPRLKTDIWQKSYLIEFLNQNGTTAESFTFSVPPESEDLTYSQRKSETKTFGGLHVDDYGEDAVKISLSGSTINQELKKVYCPPAADQWMTGEEEIYYFRDLIRKYKTGKDNIEKVIMLYDLSKTNKRKSSNSIKNIKNYWRVFPGDFKIRRGSDRPFTYKYSIEFTGVDPEREGIRIKKYPNIGNFDINAALDNIDAMFEKLDETLSWMEDVSDKINKVRQQVAGVKAIAQALTDGITGYVNNIAEGVNSITNEAFGLYDDVTRGTIVMVTNMALDFQNSNLNLLKCVENVAVSTRRILDPDYYVPQEVLDKMQMNAYEYQDTINSIMNKSEDETNSIVAVSKSLIPQVTIGDAGRSIVSYGSIPVQYTDTDNFESLAMTYFGDPEKALDIAVYNGVASLSELQPGAILKIPILNPADANLDNLIYARQGDHDTYGRDISLSDSGSIEVSETGDFKLKDGSENLAQGILLRLRENVDKRIRVNTYGIRTNISDPVAGVAYVLASVEMTIIADPRVKSVDDIQFRGIGDGLFVEVFYTDRNNVQKKFSRSI